MNKYIEYDLLKRENVLLKMENEKLKADLDYIAMMTDIELEDNVEHKESE